MRVHFFVQHSQGQGNGGGGGVAHDRGGGAGGGGGGPSLDRIESEYQTGSPTSSMPPIQLQNAAAAAAAANMPRSVTIVALLTVAYNASSACIAI